MKIELMKIAVRGLELLNLKFETRKHCVGKYNDYFADITAKTVWNDQKQDEILLSFSPLCTHFGVQSKKRYVMVLLEANVQLTKGSFEIALYGNVMQDDDRLNLN